MKLKDSVSGIVLSGGKSSRMGRDKALIPFKGKLLIHYAIELMQKTADEIIISANNPGYKKLNYPIVADNYQDVGPIGGIEASLKLSTNRINLTVPCDNPFLRPELYRRLLDEMTVFDAVVPLNAEGKPEPLIACYSKDALPLIVAQIEKGNYKVQDFLKQIRTHYVKTNLSFQNFNTPEDINVHK